MYYAAIQFGGRVLLSFPAGTMHLGGFGLERSWTRELSQAELRLTDPDFGSGTRDGMEFGVGTQHTD